MLTLLIIIIDGLSSMNKVMMIAKLLSDSPEFIDVDQEIKNKITRCTFYGRQYTDNDPVILKFRSCVNKYKGNKRCQVATEIRQKINTLKTKC